MFKIIILTLLSFTILAKEIIPINKGEISPIDGYVIDSDMEKEMRKFKLETLTLKELSVIQDNRIEFYKNETLAVKKELTKQTIKTTVYTIGGFALGVGLSALTLYVLKDAIK